jgi:hypothetical protein
MPRERRARKGQAKYAYILVRQGQERTSIMFPLGGSYLAKRAVAIQLAKTSTTAKAKCSAKAVDDDGRIYTASADTHPSQPSTEVFFKELSKSMDSAQASTKLGDDGKVTFRGTGAEVYKYLTAKDSVETDGGDDTQAPEKSPKKSGRRRKKADEAEETAQEPVNRISDLVGTNGEQH